MNFLDPAPTPFDWRFRLFDTDVRVSGWFWILPALFGASVASLVGVVAFFIVVGSVLLSILIHEFGHVFAGRRFGAESYVVLNGFGGAAVGCDDVAKRWQRIIVFLAGPMAQLLVGIPLWLGFELILRTLHLPAAADHPVYIFLMALACFNLSWPLFNLLPIWPLDGWQVAREIAGYVLGQNAPPWEQHANWWKSSSPSNYWNEERQAKRSPRSPAKLLFGLLVVSIIGLLVVREQHWRKREEAFAEFEKLGARTGRDGDRVFGFDFERTDLGDEQLALIELFDEISNLDLARTRVTDAGLRHMRGLTKLESLYLQNTQVTDAGLAELRPLTELRLLFLYRTQVTDAGLSHLRHLHKLEYLSLSNTRVTDAGLAQLKDLPNLKCLHTYGSLVTDAGIAELQKPMPSLQINPTGENDDGGR